MILNLIFPVWMLFYFIPFLLLISLVGNVLIDTAIVSFYAKRSGMLLSELKWNIVFTIIFGFIADIIGGILLMFIYDKTSNEINYFHIWSNPLNVIVHILVILLVGLLIFVFNRIIYSNSFMDKKDAIKLSLALTLITMPYTFLISASIYY